MTVDELLQQQGAKQPQAAPPPAKQPLTVDQVIQKAGGGAIPSGFDPNYQPSPFLSTLKQIPEMGLNQGAFTAGNIAGQAGAAKMGLPPLATKGVGALTGAVLGAGSDWLSDHVAAFFHGKVPDEQIPSFVDDFKKNLANAGVAWTTEGVIPALKEVSGYLRGQIPTVPTESRMMNKLTGRTALKEGAIGVGAEAETLRREAVDTATEEQAKGQAQLQSKVGEAQQESQDITSEKAAAETKALHEQEQKLTKEYTDPIKAEETKQTIVPLVTPISVAKGLKPVMEPDGTVRPPEEEGQFRSTVEDAVKGPNRKMQQSLGAEYEAIFDKAKDVQIPTDDLNSRLDRVTDSMIENAKEPRDPDVRRLFAKVSEMTRGHTGEPPPGVRGRQPAGVRPPWLPMEGGSPFDPATPLSTITPGSPEHTSTLSEIERLKRQNAQLQGLAPQQPFEYDPNSPWAQEPGSWQPGEEQPAAATSLDVSPRALFGVQSEAFRIMREKGAKLQGSDRWGLGQLTDEIQKTLEQHLTIPEKLRSQYRSFKDLLGGIAYDKDFHEENPTEIAAQIFDPTVTGRAPLRVELLYGNATPAQRKTLNALLGEYVTDHPNVLKGNEKFFAPIFEQAYGKGHPLADPQHLVYVNKAADQFANIFGSNTPAGDQLRAQYKTIGEDLKEKYGLEYLKEMRPVIKQLEPYFQKELEGLMARGKTTADKVDAVQKFFGQSDLKETADKLWQYYNPDPVVAGQQALAKKFPAVRIIRGEEGIPPEQQTEAMIPAATEAKGAMQRSVMLGISKKAERSWMGTYTERVLPITIGMGAVDLAMGGVLSNWHAGMLAAGAGSKLLNPIRAWQVHALQDPAAAKAFVDAITTYGKPTSTQAILRMGISSTIANIINTYNRAAKPPPLPKIQSQGPLKANSPREDRRSEVEKLSEDALTQNGIDIQEGLRSNRLTTDDAKALLKHMAA